jgi:uncharacterized glyoxalase superfamily protein PhnB
VTSHLGPHFRILGVVLGALMVVTAVVLAFLPGTPRPDWVMLLAGSALLYQSIQELRHFGLRRVTEATSPGGVPTGSRWGIAPYFIVDDVVAAANYYRDTLGFSYDRFWNEPPSFCMVERNGITIMLAQLEESGHVRPNRTVDPEGESWDGYIWVDNADALYAEFKSKGVKITRAICDQPYGCRDFDIEDVNGYRLCFGHILT